VPPESPRIAELRRRVHADPASIAFAQLAEEYRRAGNFHEAVAYCRNGLARHPGYLSARVTLGRALMELGDLDEAVRQFELVLKSAPDNLAAIRAMAEIHQRRGTLDGALDYYKRALTLARFDPELEESVQRIAREMRQVGAPDAHDGLSFEEATSELLSAAARMPAVEPASEPEPAPQAEPPPELESAAPAPAANVSTTQPAAPTLPTPSGIPSRVDFDALLASLGIPAAAPPPRMEQLLSSDPALLAGRDLTLPELDAGSRPEDPFADLECQLRAFDDAAGSAPLAAAAASSADDRATAAMLEELDAWLRVLDAERASGPGA
jgi:tetratricopeptide (TPR) repeat protein